MKNKSIGVLKLLQAKSIVSIVIMDVGRKDKRTIGR